MRVVIVNGHIIEVKQTKTKVSTKLGEDLGMHFVFFQFGCDNLISS